MQALVSDASRVSVAMVKYQLVSRVEFVLDNGQKESHKSICDRAELLLKDQKQLQKLKEKFNVHLKKYRKRKPLILKRCCFFIFQSLKIKNEVLNINKKPYIPFILLFFSILYSLVSCIRLMHRTGASAVGVYVFVCVWCSWIQVKLKFCLKMCKAEINLIFGLLLSLHLILYRKQKELLLFLLDVNTKISVQPYVALSS